MRVPGPTRFMEESEMGDPRGQILNRKMLAKEILMVAKRVLAISSPVAVLKAVGFNTTSYEGFPGAKRHWMSGPGAGRQQIDRAVRALKSAGYNMRKQSHPEELEGWDGPGFSVKLLSKEQGGGLVVSIYRKGPMGELEQMGIDTGDLG